MFYFLVSYNEQPAGAVFMDEASKFVMDGSAAFYGNSAESVEGEGGDEDYELTRTVVSCECPGKR